MPKLAYTSNIEELRGMIRLLGEYGIIHTIPDEIPTNYEDFVKYLAEAQKQTIIEGILDDSDVQRYIQTYAPYWAGNGNHEEAKDSLKKILSVSLLPAITKRICDAIYFANGNHDTALQQIRNDIKEITEAFKKFYGIL